MFTELALVVHTVNNIVQLLCKMEKRLEILRSEMRLSWGELCEKLGIGRSMLRYLRDGNRHPSPKLLRRIEELEVGVGLREASRAGHVTGSEKQRESTPSPPGECEVPTPGNLTPEQFQSLETRLAALEADLKEVLKILRGPKR